MIIFQPVTLNWSDQDYTIPADRIMGAIATVEEVMTLGELAEASNTGRINISKLSRAYSAMLQYAGAPSASWEVVYKSMFAGNQTTALLGVRSLLIMMMPPSDLVQKMNTGATPKGKARAASNSSKRRTKRPSA